MNNYLPEVKSCRICRESAFGTRAETGMVKYSVRHNAHWACFLKTKGEAGLRSLSAWQVGQAPYLLLKEYGLLKVAEEIRKASV